jgi:formamidopyrimidine-DNA glycosylase
MPEIVEVKKYADFINDSIINQKLIDIKIINGRYKTHKPFEHFQQLLNILPLKITQFKPFSNINSTFILFIAVLM